MRDTASADSTSGLSGSARDCARCHSPFPLGFTFYLQLSAFAHPYATSQRRRGRVAKSGPGLALVCIFSRHLSWLVYFGRFSFTMSQMSLAPLAVGG